MFMTGVAAIALAVSLSTPAFAQNTGQNAGQDNGTVQVADNSEVIVTGTRIRRPNLKSASPITSVDDKEVRLQGATAVDSVLKALPQIEAGNNENQSNNSDGTAGVNLSLATWHWGPAPLMDHVDLVNVQGKGFLDDNEVAHLERDFGVLVKVEL